MRSFERSCVIGIPEIVEYRGRGTMVSPWPPSTKALMLSTDTWSSSARNHRILAESRIPAIPKTRSLGKPDTRRATSHIASSGFDTTIRTASGERGAASRTTAPTIAWFFCTRSSRDIPGLRAIPAVMMTMSDPAVSS